MNLTQLNEKDVLSLCSKYIYREEINTNKVLQCSTHHQYLCPVFIDSMVIILGEIQYIFKINQLFLEGISINYIKSDLYFQSFGCFS